MRLSIFLLATSFGAAFPSGAFGQPGEGICVVPPSGFESLPPARLPTNIAADQDWGTVVGIASDTAGRVVANAQIFIDPPVPFRPPTHPIDAFGDSLGGFVVRRVTEGKHRFVVRSMGYNAARDTFTVRRGDVVIIRARLGLPSCRLKQAT